MKHSRSRPRRPTHTPRIPAAGVAAAALAMLAAAVVYLNALHNPFVYDDLRVIVGNATIRNLLDLRAVVMGNATRPIVNLSYAIDYALYGGAPFGFHLTNLLLHVADVGLLFLIAWHLADDSRRGSGRSADAAPSPRTIALASSMLLAVHPMMTEAVAYVSGRSELLCGFFFLLALLASRRWMVEEGATRWWLALALVSWLIALGSKETAAMLPFVLLAMRRLVVPAPSGERRRRLVWLYAPTFGIAGLAAAARLIVFFVVEHGGVAVHWRYTMEELVVTQRYLFLMVLPIHQSIFHSVSIVSGVFDPRVIGAALVIAGVAGAAWRVRRLDGLASLGLVWFLLLLAPSAALVVLNRGEPMAEHRVYLAAMGLFLAAGSGLGWLTHYGWPRPLVKWTVVLGTIVCTLWLSGRAMLRNSVWSSRAGLWSEAVEMAPDHWYPHLLLGEAFHAAGDHQAAAQQFLQVVRLRPEEPAAYINLGTCLTELGRLDDATKTYVELQRIDPQSTAAWNGLGAIALLQGHAEDARRLFRQALSLDSNNVQARRSLAVLAETVDKDPAEALRLCREVQALAPATPGVDECIARNQARLTGGGSR